MKCTLITPMFSYGAYRAKAEVRAAEIKGMMRYVYRIACPVDYQTLGKDEAELFGGPTGNGASESGHASPIRLLISENNTKSTPGYLLCHKDKESLQYMTGSFEVELRLNSLISSGVQKKYEGAKLGWYEELLQLTFTLCGLGKRSRKGRGSIAVEGCAFDTKEEAAVWICRTLNKVIRVSSKPLKPIYSCTNGVITSGLRDGRMKRPVIKKIYVGKKLEQDRIKDYFKYVDQVSHENKYNDFPGKKERDRADSKAKWEGRPVKNYKWDEMDEEYKRAVSTGYSGPRLASPLIISFIKTKEGIYPLYVFVKAIHKNNEIDPDCGYRQRFIKVVEKRMERRSQK